MINVEHSIIIGRPIAEVFAYVSDLRNSREWQNGVLEVRKMTEGPLGKGTEFTAVRKFLGRKVEGSVEFVEYQPNTIVTFRSTSGPIPVEASYLFEPAPEGTKVTSKLEMRPGGFLRLAKPLIVGSLKRDGEPAFRALKALLENGLQETSA